MSLARAAIATLGYSGFLTAAAMAQAPSAAMLPQVHSSGDIQVEATAGRPAMVRALQQSDDTAGAIPPEAQQAEIIPPKSRYENRPQNRSRNESDATQVEAPSVAQPPIALDNLSIPNLSLEGVGTGDIPDDMTRGRLPDPIPLPIGWERGIELSYVKLWANPGFCHQPLYYEQAMLERHGHQRFPYLMPVISGLDFFGRIPLSPYQWTLRHPLEEQHTLGSYRPGTPAPLLRQRLPYEPEAIRNQVLATGAAAVAIP